MYQERDRLYSQPSMSEEEGLQAAELENEFAMLDGYTAESAAGELLLAVGIPEALHQGPMSEVAPGWKLRVLLAQALFANPDIMLLDEPTNNLDIDTIRWLEGVLNERKCTMIIISHDRHFLNTVCTHMADLDYRELRVFPGNYDEYMTAATQARERMLSENAKKKAQIADLQAFVSRFSANASKSRQATSRARQIEKIELEEVKPSSRMSPYIRFEQDKKLLSARRRASRSSARATATADLPRRRPDDRSRRARRDRRHERHRQDDAAALHHGRARAQSRHRQVGRERRGRRTCRRTTRPRSRNAVTVFDWMRAAASRATTTRRFAPRSAACCSAATTMAKTVDKLSGGERGRMLFGEIMLKRPNIIVMDEPTNHLDMESIEALNLALENYPGTVIFVSHDREFVSSLATRIIEIKPEGLIDFTGSYDDYLRSRGITIDLQRAASQ